MKRFCLAAVVLVCTALAVGFVNAPWSHAQEPANSNGESVVQEGLAIAPVPLNLEGKDPALVARGSYLVNATADCGACHTHLPYAPGGNPFIGQTEQINTPRYLAGGRHFKMDASGLTYLQGDVVSRNLTPDANGLPAGLTLDEFVGIIRTGVDDDHLQPQYGPLLQVMPWPTFRKMTDRDLRAIYEFLSAIPHADPQ